MGRPKGVSTGKERLIEAAGRSFRVGGYGGTGIDTVAREAGLTSGAFYAHFGSKAKAFRTVLVDGLGLLLAGVQAMRAQHGEAWLDAFVDFYLGDRLAVDLSQACALPTLTSDVARADEETREEYQQRLNAVVDAIASGLGGPVARPRAWRLLAVLSGAAGMARAVPDPVLRDELIAAARAAAKAV